MDEKPGKIKISIYSGNTSENSSYNDLYKDFYNYLYKKIGVSYFEHRDYKISKEKREEDFRWLKKHFVLS